MMVMILYPIFNMPAFVPGAILTFLSMNILGSLGAWAILIMLAEFVFFTVIFWKILRTIYMKVHTFEGTIHTVTKGIFFAYVALCYAIPGIALINTDNPEANIGLRIFFGIAIFVCGLGYYSKRIKEE